MNTILQRLATLLCLAVCAIAFNQRLYGQAAPANQPVVVDGPMRQKLVDNIIRELHAKYVAPEKVKGIETHLRAKLQSGAYDKSTTPNQFASALTTDLRNREQGSASLRYLRSCSGSAVNSSARNAEFRIARTPTDGRTTRSTPRSKLQLSQTRNHDR